MWWVIFYLFCVTGLFTPLSTVAAQGLKLMVSYTGVGPTQLPVWVPRKPAFLAEMVWMFS